MQVQAPPPRELILGQDSPAALPPDAKALENRVWAAAVADAPLMETLLHIDVTSGEGPVAYQNAASRR